MHHMAVICSKVPIIDYCIVLVNRIFGVVDDLIGEVGQGFVGTRFLSRDDAFSI